MKVVLAVLVVLVAAHAADVKVVDLRDALRAGAEFGRTRQKPGGGCSW
jgi:hypothetical protein